MTIFKFELKGKLKGVLYWSLAFLAFNVFYFAFFPVIAKEAKLFEEVMSSFPPELLAAFGLGGLPMSSIEGYTALMFTFGALLTGIYASNQGFSLLTKEESEATADFLFTKPVSRCHIFTSKLAVAMITITLTCLGYLLSMYISIVMFKGDAGVDVSALMFALSNVFLVSLFFFSISLVISTFIKKLKNIVSASLGLTFIFYTLNAFTSAIDSTKDSFEWNPFAAYDFVDLYTNQKFVFGSIVYLLVIAVGSLIFSYIRYSKRNISSL